MSHPSRISLVLNVHSARLIGKSDRNGLGQSGQWLRARFAFVYEIAPTDDFSTRHLDGDCAPHTLTSCKIT